MSGSKSRVMNARDANTVTRPGPPDHVGDGPVVDRRLRPTDPWLRMDGHGASESRPASLVTAVPRACGDSRSASWKAG
jgi:hypothetical protein